METLSNITTIGIWFIGILFTIIGFFVVFYFKISVKSNDYLNESVTRLQLSVTTLNGTILAQDDSFNTFTGTCGQKHSVIDKRLDKHGDKLDEHEGRIIKIEQKV